MASEFPIISIIQFASISQYLAGNDKSRLDQLKSGSFIGDLPGLLYMENYLLQNINNLNPSSSTLRGTAEYVLSLCGKYGVQAKNIVNNLVQSPPIITGPANQSVNTNQNATFSVTITSSLPILSIAWFDYLGNPIVGATGLTYTFMNAQLADSGKTFFAKATNAAGQSVSGTATLTVSAALVALTWYGDLDPNPDLQAGIDNLSYQITTPVTHNQPIVITIPQAATPNKWFVTKIVDTESLKTIWNNTLTNNGTINPPDGVFNAQIQFGGNTFYPTHEAISLDYHSPLTLS